jgi:hypothetical protein
MVIHAWRALAEHLQNPWPGRGRPARLDPAIVSRIVMQRNAGLTFAAIAAALVRRRDLDVAKVDSQRMAYPRS